KDAIRTGRGNPTKVGVWLGSLADEITFRPVAHNRHSRATIEYLLRRIRPAQRRAVAVGVAQHLIKCLDRLSSSRVGPHLGVFEEFWIIISSISCKQHTLEQVRGLKLILTTHRQRRDILGL